MIIAIDGPAGAGKGTLGRRLADRFGLPYLDTGKLYRAVGWSVVAGGGNPEDPQAAAAAACQLDPTLLSDPVLRSEVAGSAASKVAAIPAVRAALLTFQRRFADTPPGAVLDGRDIGTVVCPHATIKLFVTASIEARAQRRWKELLADGHAAIWERVLADLTERDARDGNRAEAPMRPAETATLLDTSAMDADAAYEAALKIIADHGITV